MTHVQPQTEPEKQIGVRTALWAQWTAPRQLALVLALVLLAWSGACVRGGFSFDDAEAIALNPYVEGELPWSQAWRRDYWHHRGDAGHWRPSALVSLRVDRALWAEIPLGYHATNVFLHALVVGLAFFVLRRLPGQRIPLGGLMLFAVHPVLADSVAWISGRTSMLAAIGGLIGLACAQRARSSLGLVLATAVGLALALAGKEDALAFSVPLTLVAWTTKGPGTRGPRTVAVAAGIALALALVAWLRAQALGDAWPRAPHAPLAAEELTTRLAVSGRAWIEGLRLAVLPIGYPPAYGATELAQLPVTRPWLGALFWLGVALAVFVASRRHSPAAASLLSCVAATLPASQIIPAGEVFAPRFLYLPLLFAIPWIDAALARLPRWFLPVLLGAFIGLAWERAGIYANRASFRYAVLQHAPDDAGSWNNLGLAFEEQGQLDRARAAWEHSTRVDPTYGRAWSNLGRLALSSADLQAAEVAFARAVELGAANPIAHVNLASLHLRCNRPREAVEHYARATELAPGLAPAWRGLARAHWRSGESAAAQAAIARALELAPADAASRQLAQRIHATAAH